MLKKTNRADGMKTKKLLLEAATELFALYGFTNTKTVDICKKAKANVASVNYYFGGKAQIYVAAWRHAFSQSIQKYPPDGGVAETASPEIRLRAHVLALVHRFMDPHARDMVIADREMANPTGLLTEVMLSSIKPLREMLSGIVKELLGPNASAHSVKLCEMSVHAQCHIALIHTRERRFGPLSKTRACLPQLDVEPEIIAEHIVHFSLAGIQGIQSNPDFAKI